MNENQEIAQALMQVARALDADVGDVEEIEPVDPKPVKTRRTKKMRQPTAAELWQKVAAQFGEKAAVGVHSDLLKQAAKYSDDDRLNPDGTLWVDEFMPVMMDACIKKLREMQRRMY